MTDDTHGDLDAILNDHDALVPGEPPLVLVTNAELLLVLEGRELAFIADDGTKVRIRLCNTDELIAARRAARSPLTRAKAAELCMPLSEIMRRRVRPS